MSTKCYKFRLSRFVISNLVNPVDVATLVALKTDPDTALAITHRPDPTPVPAEDMLDAMPKRPHIHIQLTVTQFRVRGSVIEAAYSCACVWKSRKCE